MTAMKLTSGYWRGSNSIFIRPQSLNRITDRWARKINAKKRTGQTQAPVQHRMSHNKLSSSSGTYNISSSNNLRDRTMIKQSVFITSVLAISVSWAGCTNRAALMAWPGIKQAGVCNADGKTVAAGPPAKPCPPPCPPKIYGEHPVAYTSQVRTPDEMHVYDVGRLPHGQGGMIEAHQYYRIEQSAHWDLRLPSKKTASTGPRGPFYPPTYQPPPNDQRVRDAVNAADQERLRAEEAKRNIEAATGEVRQRLQEDNQLKDALREQLDTNRKLREQLEQNKPNASPSPSQSSPSTDALKQWGEQLNRPNGPTPAGTPTQ